MKDVHRWGVVVLAVALAGCTSAAEKSRVEEERQRRESVAAAEREQRAAEAQRLSDEAIAAQRKNEKPDELLELMRSWKPIPTTPPATVEEAEARLAETKRQSLQLRILNLRRAKSKAEFGLYTMTQVELEYGEPFVRNAQIVNGQRVEDWFYPASTGTLNVTFIGQFVHDWTAFNPGTRGVSEDDLRKMKASE